MLQTLLDSLRVDLGPWIYLIVFAAAASESALFVGLVVPGETVLVLAGVLASRGQGHLIPFMGVAIAGAVIGDSIGYELGRHFGPRLRRSALGRRVGEERWERAERYLRERGGRSIFFARWVLVVRAIVPALAGQARMPYRRFLLWNVAGAVPLAVVHVGLGYIAGRSYASLDRYLRISHWLLLAVVALIAAIAYWRHRRGDSERG
jgi:membrane protein DedA with SNARE-associated domain